MSCPAPAGARRPSRSGTGSPVSAPRRSGARLRHGARGAPALPPGPEGRASPRSPFGSGIDGRSSGRGSRPWRCGSWLPRRRCTPRSRARGGANGSSRRSRPRRPFGTGGAPARLMSRVPALANPGEPPVQDVARNRDGRRRPCSASGLDAVPEDGAHSGRGGHRRCSVKVWSPTPSWTGASADDHRQGELPRLRSPSRAFGVHPPPAGWPDAPRDGPPPWSAGRGGAAAPSRDGCGRHGGRGAGRAARWTGGGGPAIVGCASGQGTPRLGSDRHRMDMSPERGRRA